MNWLQFIEDIAVELNVTKKEAKKVVEAFLNRLVSNVAVHGEVSFRNYLTFKKKNVSSKLGVNPKNPTQRVQYPAFNKLTVKGGKYFKEFLNA